MTEKATLEDTAAWRDELRDFIAATGRGDLPTREDITDALQDWQRRITGGVIVQFFEFLEKTATPETYPILAKHPLPERTFLLITDEPGAAAATELMDMDTDQAMCVLKEKWRAFLEAEGTEKDEEMRFHYQFWSVWHQNLPSTWELPAEPEGDYWIHEEGFALADGAGRGAQHLWIWDGEEMRLAQETMTSWVS